MTDIASDKVAINNSQEHVFNFLSNLHNFRQLMPEGRISDWDSTETTCSFKITGLAKIGMKLGNSTPPSNINMVSHGKNPFDFQLNISIESTGENTCSSQMVFEAKVNPFMKTMITTPLTNFFNMLAYKLKEINE